MYTQPIKPNELFHSAKGTTWKNHKYIRKKGNIYIYPDSDSDSNSNNKKYLMPKQAEDSYKFWMSHLKVLYGDYRKHRKDRETNIWESYTKQDYRDSIDYVKDLKMSKSYRMSKRLRTSYEKGRKIIDSLDDQLKNTKIPSSAKDKIRDQRDKEITKNELRKYSYNNVKFNSHK